MKLLKWEFKRTYYFDFTFSNKRQVKILSTNIYCLQKE